MSLIDTLIAAAAPLPGSFTKEELLIAAWKADPEAFGLRGFEQQHPDSNKVAACLYGKKGLIARGLLMQVNVNRLQLTRAAKKRICNGVAHEEPPEPPPTKPLSPRLKLILESTTYRLFKEDKKDLITYGGAIGFWGSTKLSVAEAFQNQLDRDDPAQRELLRLHEYLLEKFGQHLRKE